MTEPITVDAPHFFDFVGTPGLKVLLVSVHSTHSFNQALGELLAAEHGAVTLGTVGLGDLITRGGAAIPFLSRAFRHCGAPGAFGVLPGYCLFRGAEMLAWDAGLPAAGDLKGILRGTLLGIIWSSVTNDLSFMASALLFATDHAAAQRMAGNFRDAVNAPRGRRQASGPAAAPPIDEIRWAYQLLGVSSSATDREVHHAWRRLRMEHHPDHAGSDRAEFERRSRISAEINHARDVIVSSRSERGRRANSAAA